MKTKALILGAKPSLFEGPWVSISEVEKWRTRVSTSPHGMNVSGHIVVEVEGSPRVTLPFEDGLEIAGHKARVVIVKAIESCDSLSLTLEAV